MAPPSQPKNLDESAGRLRYAHGEWGIEGPYSVISLASLLPPAGVRRCHHRRDLVESTIMVPLIILGVIVSIPYGVYRAVKRWGIAVLCFLAAAVSFLGSSGVVAEYLWGPRWAWNFAHHGTGYATGALFQGICFLVAGLNFKASRQREPH
jgi:hypothetical protein